MNYVSRKISQLNWFQFLPLYPGCCSRSVPVFVSVSGFRIPDFCVFHTPQKDVIRSVTECVSRDHLTNPVMYVAFWTVRLAQHHPCLDCHLCDRPWPYGVCESRARVFLFFYIHRYTLYLGRVQLTLF